MLRIVGTHYPSDRYLTFAQAVRNSEGVSGTPLIPSLSNQRASRIEGHLGQQLGPYGLLHASVAYQTYHQSMPANLSMRVGYSGSSRYFSHALYYEQSRTLNGQPSRQIMLSLNFPLGQNSTLIHAAHGGVRFMHDNMSGWRQDIQIDGTALDDARLGYGVGMMREAPGAIGSSGYISYAQRQVMLSANASATREYWHIGANLSGSIVLHSGGLTFGQPLSDTAVLVDTNGAAGVRIASHPGISTDARGYALVSSVSPYRKNRVALDADDVPENIELKDTAIEVIPTRGALVKTRFDTAHGLRALMTLRGPNGQPLPFGAQIYDSLGNEVGMVGEDGESYVAGLPEHGILTVRWGKDKTQQCVAEYRIDASDAVPLAHTSAQCLQQPTPPER
ncbi:hypothetical protein DFQ28_009863 [Apophysomyces sp. BC1034]|nr:hypothetical protein DFQ28_009863 [Apophysomyces sp. BC1034]